MQQTTDNRQQTACKRTRAHPRCNGKHTALPHVVCGGQRAADNQQHARSIVRGNQCATRHITYDRGRSMQQTRMKIHGVSRTKSGSSRTSGLGRARCAGPWAAASQLAKCEGRELLWQTVRADCGEPIHAPSLRRLPDVQPLPCTPLLLARLRFRGVFLGSVPPYALMPSFASCTTRL